MAGIIWNSSKWGNVGGAPASPDVKVLYVQTSPIVGAGPCNLTTPLVSVDFNKSEIIGKTLEVGFTITLLSGGSESVNRELYCLLKNKGSNEPATAGAPMAMSFKPSETTNTWTFEGDISFRRDGTYVASFPRWNGQSFNNWAMIIEPQPTPAGERMVFEIAAIMSAHTETVTVEHGHVAIVG